MNVKIIQSEEIFSGHIFGVKKDKIELPNGVVTERETVCKYKTGSVIIPIDNEGKIIFVRQYRHALGMNILELPAGTVDGDEEPIVCAKRELEEETGYTSSDISFLLSTHPSAGYTDELLNIYVAINLQVGSQSFDFDEIIELERYSFDEAMEMIKNGHIKDGKTIIGILAAKEFLL